MIAKLQKLNIRLNNQNQVSPELMTNKTQVIYILTWKQDYGWPYRNVSQTVLLLFCIYYNETDGQQALTSSSTFTVATP